MGYRGTCFRKCGVRALIIKVSWLGQEQMGMVGLVQRVRWVIRVAESVCQVAT